MSDDSILQYNQLKCVNETLRFFRCRILLLQHFENIFLITKQRMKAAGGRAVKQLVFIFLNISSNDFHENRLELQRAVVMLCVTVSNTHTHITRHAPKQISQIRSLLLLKIDKVIISQNSKNRSVLNSFLLNQLGGDVSSRLGGV